MPYGTSCAREQICARSCALVVPLTASRSPSGSPPRWSVLPCDLPQALRPAQTRAVVHGLIHTATASVVSLRILACRAVIAGTRSAVAARLSCACSANDTARLACVALYSAQDRPSLGADGVKPAAIHPARRLLRERLPRRKISGRTRPGARSGQSNPRRGLSRAQRMDAGAIGCDHSQRRRASGPWVICDFSGIRSGCSQSKTRTRLQTGS